MKLSILDQSQINENSTPEQAVAATIAVAKEADRLGFTRFWCSEHHNMSFAVSSSPQIMISSIGQQTRGIRIGSGAVMLPNHSPYRIAEDFRLLESLFPDRIDLGLGLPGGGDSYSRSLLNPAAEDPAKADFVGEVKRLIGYFKDEDKQATANPVTKKSPKIWIMSAGGQHTRNLAAQFGLGLVAGVFNNPFVSSDFVPRYKKDFQPSAEFPKPAALAAIGCYCSDDPAILKKLAGLSDMFRTERDKGHYVDSIPSEEKVAAYKINAEDREHLDKIKDRQAIGTPAEVKKQIEVSAKRLDVDEIMLLLSTHQPEDRIKTLQLLAKEFDLQPRY